MPTTYGLTSTGLVIKTVEIIRAEIIAELQGVFGASIDVGDESLLGVLVGIMADHIGSNWELLEEIVASQDPDAATGTLLESLAALTGTFKKAAYSSTVTLYLTGTVGTVVPALSQAKTLSTGTYWQTLAAATIATVPAWVLSSAYVIGDLCTNAGRIYQCTVSGVSAGFGGPTTTAVDIIDNTCHWTYVGNGVGVVTAAAKSVLTGAIAGVARDIASIYTPVGGWSSVMNLTDALTGNVEQTDESLRVTREAELSQAGVADPDAIRAALLQITGVTSATVFVNNSDVETGTIAQNNVMPPHSVEALVLGGTDQLIFDVLFGSVAGGIAFVGSTVGTSTDSQGVAQPVKFSRPTAVNIYVDITYVKDPATYPTDGDAQVKAAISAYGQKQNTGKDAVASSVAASIFPVYVNGIKVAGVVGVLDVTQTFIGTAPAPASSVTINCSDRQLAVFDTSRVTVHTSNGTP